MVTHKTNLVDFAKQHILMPNLAPLQHVEFGYTIKKYTHSHTLIDLGRRFETRSAHLIFSPSHLQLNNIYH